MNDIENRIQTEIIKYAHMSSCYNSSDDGKKEKGLQMNEWFMLKTIHSSNLWEEIN